MSDHDDDSILGTGVTTRQVEAFGRKVTATASHLIGETTGGAYQHAITNIHQGMRRPGLQRSVFSIARASPRETLRAKLSTNEIQHRALTYIPDDMLVNLPIDENSTYSLFQGFKASLPEDEEDSDDNEKGGSRRRHRRSGRAQRLLKNTQDDEDASSTTSAVKLRKAKREQGRATHKLEMLGVRKNMCSAEIMEIDKKITNLQSMRKIVLDRLADLEDEELKLEQEITEIDIRVDDMQDVVDEEEAASKAMAALEATSSKIGESAVEKGEDAGGDDDDGVTTPGAATPATTEGGRSGNGFMSESIYEKLPESASAAKPRRQKLRKRMSMPIRHGHFEPGTRIAELPAHNDMITALDFDAPFGTMVTSALDDTLRVWDLNSGRCLGLLEGHRASVRCLQVEDTLCVTGSIDASVRLWDLSRIDTPAVADAWAAANEEGGDGEVTSAASSVVHVAPTAAATADCEIFSLEAHVAEITALHFQGDTLVSGSADKTLRQWDLVKGRCVQTLDVLWAAAQASSSPAAGGSTSTATSTRGGNASSQWRTTSRLPDANADFVGALQVFDAALACGTADGMVRLWDLRSGQVSRSLVGHTGPVTCLQFDDMHLVTGSLDRSIRIWDLRTGSIFDAFALDDPITSMMFDARRIVAAAGEPVVKVYDKADGRQWDCGAGAAGAGGGTGGGAGAATAKASVVERVRIKDGFLVEGRKDGVVGVWTC